MSYLKRSTNGQFFGLVGFHSGLAFMLPSLGEVASSLHLQLCFRRAAVCC